MAFRTPLPSHPSATSKVPDRPVDDELPEAEMDEPPELLELLEDEPQPSLIAQALRDAGLDPEIGAGVRWGHEKLDDFRTGRPNRQGCNLLESQNLPKH